MFVIVSRLVLVSHARPLQLIRQKIFVQRTRRIITLLSLTAAVGLASGGANVAQAKPTSLQKRGATVREAVRQSRLGSLPDRLMELGGSRFRSVYGAVRESEDGSGITIYLTRRDRAIESAFKRVVHNRAVVSFDQTANSAAALSALTSEILTDEPELAAEGIRLISWFPGENGDGLEHITVEDLTSADVQTLDAMYGQGNIVLTDNPGPDPISASVGRNSDYAPWSAGDNLTSSGIGCTSGAPITYDGLQFMITAAHCYEVGWNVYNAFAGEPGPYMGKVVSRDVSRGGDDTALISMSADDEVWTGKIGKPVSYYVSGWARNPVGSVVCNEGAYSGEACSVVQTDEVNGNGCISVSNYTGITGDRYECNVVEAYAGFDVVANQDGDSGGPMVRFENGNAYISGIVSAQDATDYPATCVYNTPDSCSGMVYYTAIDQILGSEYPGATLITGG